ncbi:Spore germination protein YndE [Pelotomaculum sp. FP]|uniref:GerAB/ArcD/ProY family transporter n=1 Tax=Pelotomaculum sp. FP TaxID=261474 RepID=UPI001101BB3A|nr:endospore germination permease [Pelotomaculum sp. FP]TEB14312.1 Spore germination protein YndE [Pelotomaculum sp. FP]
MVKSGSFGPAEAIILLAISNIARIFLPYPRLLTEIGATAAWMTPLGGLVAALVGFYVMYLVLRKNPGQSIIEITEQAFGPVAGVLLNLVTVGFFIAVGALFAREFSEALIIAALPGVPVSIISIAYLGMGVLGAYLGLEALARTARLSYPYIFGGILLLLLALIPQWDTGGLFPFFGHGPLKVFGLGTFSTAGVTEIIFAAVIIQSLGGVERFRLIGYRSMLLGFASLIIILLVVNLTFHWATMAENTLPFYRLARNIYIGRFLQRVESVFVIIWSIVAFIKIAVTLYGGAVALTQTLKLPDYRPLLWPLIIIMFILSILPPDLPTVVKLDADWLRPYALVPNYLVPLMILAALRLRRRGPREEG